MRSRNYGLHVPIGHTAGLIVIVQVTGSKQMSTQQVAGDGSVTQQTLQLVSGQLHGVMVGGSTGYIFPPALTTLAIDVTPGVPTTMHGPGGTVYTGEATGIIFIARRTVQGVLLQIVVFGHPPHGTPWA